MEWLEDIELGQPALPPRAAPDRRTLRTRRVARQLLELSRLTRGFERAEPQDLELVGFVRTILRDYPDAEALGETDELWTRSDARRLASALFAILDNAFVHGAPPVALSLEAGAIVITDHGAGFSPRLLAVATEPFSTGSHAAGRGVGLGLAIAAAQIRLLGGELDLANHPPAGARVTIHLAPGV